MKPFTEIGLRQGLRLGRAMKGAADEESRREEAMCVQIGRVGLGLLGSFSHGLRMGYYMMGLSGWTQAAAPSPGPDPPLPV